MTYTHPAERFDRLYTPVPECGCWLWLGAAGRYGKFAIGRRCVGLIDAHRASWYLHRGDIPAGMLVCHKCDVPLCVNPDHLFLATPKDNTQDMMVKGRHRYSTSNAPRGADHWMSRRRNERITAI